MNKLIKGLILVLMFTAFANAGSDRNFWLINNTGNSWIFNGAGGPNNQATAGFCSPTMCYIAQ